jgi:hypothetical protein
MLLRCNSGRDAIQFGTHPHHLDVLVVSHPARMDDGTVVGFVARDLQFQQAYHAEGVAMLTIPLADSVADVHVRRVARRVYLKPEGVVQVIHPRLPSCVPSACGWSA